VIFYLILANYFLILAKYFFVLENYFFTFLNFFKDFSHQSLNLAKNHPIFVNFSQKILKKIGFEILAK
jgi:hypothetical protein